MLGLVWDASRTPLSDCGRRGFDYTLGRGYAPFRLPRTPPYERLCPFTFSNSFGPAHWRLLPTDHWSPSPPVQGIHLLLRAVATPLAGTCSLNENPNSHCTILQAYEETPPTCISSLAQPSVPRPHEGCFPRSRNTHSNPAVFIFIHLFYFYFCFSSSGDAILCPQHFDVFLPPRPQELHQAPRPPPATPRPTAHFPSRA